MGRRLTEADSGGFPWRDIFKGDILDVGSGDDPLPGATAFDLPDGGGDDLRKFFPDRKFDLIHGSQVLEHAFAPHLMLQSWIACLKPGGYIVATVPDWVLYEKMLWPSKYNTGHRSTWSLDQLRRPVAPHLGFHIKLPEWLNQFLNTDKPCELLLCRLVNTNYDYSLGPHVDQTYDSSKGVECFVEFVLRRTGESSEDSSVEQKSRPRGVREFVVSILPRPVHAVLRPWWRRLFWFQRRVRERWIPLAVWLVWLVAKCARHRKRAIVICRFGGIGDVVCTLPMCDEVRHRHPGKMLVFVTAAIWREVVVMSRSADLVYANRTWVHPFTLRTSIKLFGLVDTIYNPQTIGERLSHTFGTTTHLIEDLAASCGFKVTARLPRLSPSPRLIQKTRVAYGLDRNIVGERLLIGINPGPSWRVREWEASKWQKLINKIHSDYDAVIIQFGLNKGDGSSEYDNLTGVKSLASRLNGHELVALIAICDLMISIDSGPVHLAGVVGTPVVGLFGPLNPASRLPPDSPATGLFSDVPCLFCNNRTPVLHWFDGCPNDIACMKKLDEGTVFEAVKSMLAHCKKREVKEPLTAFD
jgi:ADP-heptose:LPS heptosyltransferase/SAM-dependent methyltransferase